MSIMVKALYLPFFMIKYQIWLFVDLFLEVCALMIDSFSPQNIEYPKEAKY